MDTYCAIRALQDLQDTVGMQCLPEINISIDDGWYILNYKWRNIDWLDQDKSTRSTWIISVIDLPDSNEDLIRAHLELIDSIKKGERK